MAKQPKVSVVVPIYNVEKYLRQCLDSIIAQTLKDIEIILVNDGSKDGSLAIIKEFANKDKRIKVIDKKNEGLGKTYNRGMDEAKGEYIGFVESDDWIEPDMYETLYNVAKKNKVDVVKAKYFIFNDKDNKTDHLSALPEDELECVFNPRQKPMIFYIGASVWAGIYKREFLSNNNIRFLESPGASYQDTGFNFKIWAMADKAYLIDKALLHYRTGHETQSVKSKDKVFCICDEFAEVERYMSEKNPIRFAKLEKIFNKAKYGSYKWNHNRLEGDNREAFKQQIQKEFAPVLKRRAFDFNAMGIKDKLKLERFVFPNKVSLKIKAVLLEISRIFIKDQIRGGRKIIRILFGQITIAKFPIKNNGIEE